MRRLSESLGSYDYNVVVPNTKKMAWPYPLKLADSLLRELPPALEKKK